MYYLMGIGLGLLIIILFVISIRNTIKTMAIKVQEAFSSIDVVLMERFDKLKGLVETTKSYVKYEKETLKEITALRNPAAVTTFKEKQDILGKMDNGIKAINVTLENYPDLKADKIVSKLQQEIIMSEYNLQAIRRIYNANVAAFNKYITIFPYNIVAKKMKAKNFEFFEASKEKRENVDVSF